MNKEITLSKTNSILHELPIWFKQPHVTIFKPTNLNNSTYILNRKNTNRLYVYDFDSNKVSKTFELSEKIGFINDFIVHNDTFYALKSQKSVIVQPLENVDGYRLYQLNEDEVSTGNYITYEKDGLHINVMKSGVLNSVQKLRDFFKYNVDARITLVNDKVEIEALTMNYSEQDIAYPSIENTHISKAYTSEYSLYSLPKEQITHLFQYSNPEQFSAIDFNSNYYDYSINTDTSMAFEFNKSYSSFVDMIYNPYRKEFYRINIHSIKEYNNRPFYRDWSLIVSDDRPKVKYEILFEGGEYIYNKIIPTKKGFAILKLPEDIEEESQLILHEYEI